MILTKEVTIKVNPNNFKNLEKFGYKDFKSNQLLVVKVEHLSYKNNSKISVKCDLCGKEREIKHSTYMESTKKQTEIYVCHGKCSNIKRDRTNLELYGVKNCFQSEEKKNKIKETYMNNFGVDHNMKLQKYKDKRVETYMNNYGFDNPSKSTEIKNKKIKTCNKNFGVDHPFQRDVIMEKSIKTNLEKYCTMYSKTNECKNKVRSTCLKRYGVEYPQQSQMIRDKSLISLLSVHKYKETDLHYQCSYELDFLNKYHDKLNIKNGITVKYCDKFYFPDFFVPELNLIVEIKSKYWYEKDLEQNLLKQKSCLEQGYNFIFIINKKYDEFEELIYNQKSASL